MSKGNSYLPIIVFITTILLGLLSLLSAFRLTPTKLSEVFVGESYPGCFLAGTHITLADGSQKTIENITTQDRVLSVTPDGQQYPQEVEKTFTFKRDHYNEILLDNGTLLKVTDEHPFLTTLTDYDENNWRESYTEAKDLQVGNTIYSLTDNKITPQKIVEKKVIWEPVEVYNLAVAKTHTFLAENILVHNKLPNMDDIDWDCLATGQCTPTTGPMCPASGGGSAYVVEAKAAPQSLWDKIKNFFVTLFTGKTPEAFPGATDTMTPPCTGGGGAGSACTSTSECSSGSCIEGQCVSEQAGFICTPPCGAGEACVSGQCVSTVQPPNNCTAANPCPGGCPGQWNCWPDRQTWEAAFCAYPGHTCEGGQPPAWAYNDVADAVNFVNQHGYGPSDADWLDRWHSGHTWGQIGGGCPTGSSPVAGTCYIDGFQPGATLPGCSVTNSQACPTGCAMTQCPTYNSSGGLTSVVCDCPSGDGQCGGGADGGGLGYFTDPDCGCIDTDPSTECGASTGDDTTGDDDDDDDTTASPSPSPSFSYQCVSLNPQNPTPQPGSTTRFTCTGESNNIRLVYANFRVLLDNDMIASQGGILLDNTTHQANFDFTLPSEATPGSYLVQCKVCAENVTCTDWGQALGIHEEGPPLAR